MLPGCVPVPLVVVTVTSVPVSRRVLMAVLVIVELLAVGVKTPPATVLLAVAPVIATFESGSNNHDPPFPCSAPAPPRTPVASRILCPEVSIKPPLPDCAPPLAQMEPWALVNPSDQRITLPPLPLVTASALMTALLPINTALALVSGPKPWKFPPTNTVPPPASPEAFSNAFPNNPTLSPRTVIVPPFCPAPNPEASSVPVTLVTPVEPPSK